MQGECRATMGECFGDAKILILATHSRVKICPCDGGITSDMFKVNAEVWRPGSGRPGVALVAVATW